jgi:hypothetical protein
MDIASTDPMTARFALPITFLTEPHSVKVRMLCADRVYLQSVLADTE